MVKDGMMTLDENIDDLCPFDTDDAHWLRLSTRHNEQKTEAPAALGA